MPHEIFPQVPFPFEGGEFPRELGAVVQWSVVRGEEPVRVVIHDADNEWLVGDGVGDPNEPGALVVVCLRSIVDRDPSLTSLVDLPVGHEAWRDQPGERWSIERHEYAPD